ncbi:MAG: hypothetical protein HYV68_03190 [Candidatus Taylorbacteria bacterium]|nr:hypothetical protein [Candidatus Taylorbacteria bacterium]
MKKPRRQFVVLTGELLFKFLGGIVVVKNPSCCLRGTADEMSFVSTNKGITTIGFVFKVIEDIPPPAKPFTDPGVNARPDYIMDFEVRSKAVLYEGDILSIFSSVSGEYLILKEADPL